MNSDESPSSENEGDDYRGMWYVIETPKDFCIVKETDILFNDELSLGETANFFWNKSHGPLRGNICFMNADIDKCEAEARKLLRASKLTHEQSFHSNRPRKSALKFKEMLKRKVTDQQQCKNKTAQSSSGKKKKSETDQLREQASNKYLLQKEASQLKNKDKAIYVTNDTKFIS